MEKPKIIDISVPLKEGMPVWPKSSGIHLKQELSLEKGDLANVTRLDIDLHTGTHIDSPLHFIPRGLSLDKIPLKKLIGPALVVHLPKVKIITAENLKRFNLPKGVTRLLLKTFNSNLWKKRKFQKNFVGLDVGAAFWLVKQGIQLVGIDYLSVAREDEMVKVHQVFLKNKIVILEGLNLSKVKPGLYQLICLPPKFIGIEAAPARAVLISL